MRKLEQNNDSSSPVSTHEDDINDRGLFKRHGSQTHSLGLTSVGSVHRIEEAKVGEEEEEEDEEEYMEAEEAKSLEENSADVQAPKESTPVVENGVNAEDEQLIPSDDPPAENNGTKVEMEPDSEEVKEGVTPNAHSPHNPQTVNHHEPPSYEQLMSEIMLQNELE